MSLNKTMRSTIKLFPLILLLTLSFFVFSTKQASAITYTCGDKPGYCQFGSIEFKASNLNYESGDYTWTCGKVSCPLNYTIVEAKPVNVPADTIVTIGDEEPAPIVDIEIIEPGGVGYVYDRNGFARSKIATVTATNGDCDCPECGELFGEGDTCKNGKSANFKIDENGKKTWRCIDDCGNISALCKEDDSCIRPRCSEPLNNPIDCKTAAVCGEGSERILLNSDENGCNWRCALTELSRDRNIINGCEGIPPVDSDGKEFVDCSRDISETHQYFACAKSQGGNWSGYDDGIESGLGPHFFSEAETTSSGERITAPVCSDGFTVCKLKKLDDGGYHFGWQWHCCPDGKDYCSGSDELIDKYCGRCFAYKEHQPLGGVTTLITPGGLGESPYTGYVASTTEYTSFVAPTTVGMGYFSSMR